jgi:vancomycin permeability regulator SanA
MTQQLKTDIGRVLIILTALFGVNLAMVWGMSWRIDRIVSRHLVDSRTGLVVVLFGDFTRDYKALAVSLYQVGQAKKILFVGGCRPARNINGADMMALAATQMNVPVEDVRSDACSWDTHTNLNETGKFLEEYQSDVTIFVSDRFHLARVYSILLKNPINSQVLLAPTPNQGILVQWVRIHQELAANLSEALPHSVRTFLLRTLRGQSKPHIDRTTR